MSGFQKDESWKTERSSFTRELSAWEMVFGLFSLSVVAGDNPDYYYRYCYRRQYIDFVLSVSLAALALSPLCVCMCGWVGGGVGGVT